MCCTDAIWLMLGLSIAVVTLIVVVGILRYTRKGIIKKEEE